MRLVIREYLSMLREAGELDALIPESHLQGTLGAHVEGGSGRSAEASPTAILQDTHSVEGLTSEVRVDGVRGSPEAPAYGFPFLI